MRLAFIKYKNTVGQTTLLISHSLARRVGLRKLELCVYLRALANKVVICLLPNNNVRCIYTICQPAEDNHPHTHSTNPNHAPYDLARRSVQLQYAQRYDLMMMKSSRFILCLQLA